MIRILLDSTSDLSPAECLQEGFELVPMTVHIAGREYTDGVDLDKEEFYRLLAQGGEFPKTSQPSPDTFAKVFERVKADGDELICILLSSALSGTYQSACIAKAMVEYEKIYLIDTLRLTAGVRILAMHAKNLIAQGLTGAQVAAEIEMLKGRVQICAAIDTLEYLEKGGRLGKAAASFGTMFHLKPVIAVSEEGELEVVDKPIGKVRAMQAILGRIGRKPVDPDFPVYTIFSAGEANVALLEKRMAEAGLPAQQRLRIGSSIGAHIGPGAYGAVWIEADI